MTPPMPNIQPPMPNIQPPMPNIQSPMPSIQPPDWKHSMENRMNSFDTKLDGLVDILKTNQRYILENQRLHQESANNKRRLEDYTDGPSKQARLGPSEDFRNRLLTIEEARELFAYFDANITQQLFGFEISKISVDSVWISSPILVCTICTIASMHHPSAALSEKSGQLQDHLHTLCADLVYKGRPKTEIEGFNTILALVCCSFWLSDSQMFTGIALQIAKEIGLDKPVSRSKSGSLSQKDRLKLYYLIYILDGQQSITFNRRPLVNAEEFTLQNSRALILKEKRLQHTEVKRIGSTADLAKKDAPEQEPHHQLTDLRLVSQVEYNQAISCAFRGDAWDLLAPSSFGIPSKSNLELDKWMVSWTVLLSPIHKAGVWSSKSTLIYYNFAKMHINSAAMRRLQMDDSTDSGFPSLSELNGAEKPYGPEVKSETPQSQESEDWEESSDEEDEFIKFGEVAVQDNNTVNAAIASNAAQTVLNLVLNDKDIANNLKYVPVHVHIMLYYACMLLLSPETDAHVKDDAYFRKILTNLATVVSLKKIIANNFPVDRTFGIKLIKSLQELIDEVSGRARSDLNEETISHDTKTKLFDQLKAVSASDASQIEFLDDSSRGSSPGTIAAWPGSNHGHP